MVKTVTIRDRWSVDRAGGGLPAFTLIELLVVVAIIALLVAILVPAIRQAQEISKTVACMAHQRNYHRGMHVWAEENYGRMVPMTVQSTLGPGFNYWWHELLGSGGGANPSTLPTGVNVPVLQGAGTQENMQCPKAWDKTTGPANALQYWGTYDTTWMYGYNEYAAHWQISDRPKPFIWMADCTRRALRHATAPLWPPELPGTWGKGLPGWCRPQYLHEVRVKTTKSTWVTKITGTGKANWMFSDGSVRTYLFDASIVAPNASGWKASGEGQPIPQNPYLNGANDFRTDVELQEAKELWGLLKYD